MFSICLAFSLLIIRSYFNYLVVKSDCPKQKISNKILNTKNGYGYVKHMPLESLVERRQIAIPTTGGILGETATSPRLREFYL